jgi:LytS/YehU family sensor histidine kinase
VAVVISFWPRVRQSLAIVAIVLPFAAWMSLAGSQALPGIIRSLPLPLVLAATITAFVYSLFPVAMHLTAAWPRAAASLVYVITMAVCAAAGTALAFMVPLIVAGTPAGDVAVAFRENLAGTLPVTIVICVVMIVHGNAKARLEVTELSLKTQQLERERAEKLATEAQLASLSSRVQPHFLFNTLNTISGLIREQPSRAEAMIEHLSSLLRSSLDGREVVPIAQELKLVTDYLEIQRTRLGSRLRYDLAVADNAAGVVPPFALQTMVENSLKHIAGRRPEGVVLRIGIRRDGDRLVLDVTDDGPGFDPDAMRAGHGLDILARRLRAIFGDAATLTFDRQPGSMTVRVNVPIT